MIRVMDREQRNRSKPSLEKSILEDDPRQLGQYSTNSNFQRLLNERLKKQTQLEVFEMHPRASIHGKPNKAVKDKLWKYARGVMRMEQRLGDINPSNSHP